jgi:hypothetical protein
VKVIPNTLKTVIFPAFLRVLTPLTVAKQGNGEQHVFQRIAGLSRLTGNYSMPAERTGVRAHRHERQS